MKAVTLADVVRIAVECGIMKEELEVVKIKLGKEFIRFLKRNKKLLEKL